jgi:L-asparaginase
MKKILLIGLGGTIACSATKEGLVPMYSPERFLSQEPRLLTVAHIKTIQLMMRTIIYPKDWITIAKFISKSVKDFDGFVITMGTDTLAYTSSMLSFMLRSINKPVIITGAMIPIEKENSDARKNLIDSVIFACEPTSGIFVVFNGNVIRGCRASKVSGVEIDAFKSINFPLIAKIINGQVKYDLSIKEEIRENNKLSLEVKIDTKVLDIKLTPQVEPDLFGKLLGYKGFVIEGYGDGNISDNLIPVIIKLIKGGKVVVLASQCAYGHVEHKYRGGLMAVKNGAISVRDMTKESALTKLMWCMGKTKNVKTIGNMMTSNMCGEIKII